MRKSSSLLLFRLNIQPFFHLQKVKPMIDKRQKIIKIYIAHYYIAHYGVVRECILCIAGGMK